MHLDRRISGDHQATEAFGVPFEHRTRVDAGRGSLRVTAISSSKPNTDAQASAAGNGCVTDDARSEGTAELELSAETAELELSVGMVPQPLSAAQAVPSEPSGTLDTAIEYLRDCYPHAWPALTLVLGSGLAEVVAELEVHAQVQYADVPGFPIPSIVGHAGTLSIGNLAGVAIAVLQGREHYYEHGRADAMAVPIRALRALGCTHLLMTNAVGSADPQLLPGSLVLISDHINLTGANPLIGMTAGSECFVDMTNAYDVEWRAQLKTAAAAIATPLAERVYACFSGPSFETPAEIRAARILGADTVGMSVAPETIIARQCGLKVAAISVVTNLAAGVANEPLGHEQTLRAAAEAAPRCAKLIRTHLTMSPV